MSILDKQFTPPPRRRRRIIFILGIVIALLVVLFLFVDVRSAISFVVHFVTAPNHFTYRGHSDYVSGVAWSPDGKRIASGSADGLVEVWEALTGGHVYTYRGHADYYWSHWTSNQAVNSLAWSPDGKEIASGSSDNTVQVWQAM